MKKSNIFCLTLGIVIGGVIFGGTIAYAAGIMAQPKTAAVVIDGQTVDLKGYVIEGNHYFQLRDLNEKLIPGGRDFSVVWDGSGNRVIIDTARGYDPDELYVQTIQADDSIGAPLASVTQPVDEAPAMTVDEMKAEIVRLTNIERVKVGVPELEILPALMDCAQDKVQDFFNNKYYGHVSPIYGTPGEMIKSYVPSAKSCAEILAPWRKSPQAVIDGILESPEHLDNVLNKKYTHIGVGIVEGADDGYWWVLQFVGL
jgi:uncharacterized protein YkwD